MSTKRAAWKTTVYAPGQRREIADPDADLRLRVMLRDGYDCRVDGCSVTRALELHHIWPAAEGGKDDLDNLVLLCNKHYDEIEEAGTAHDLATIRRWGTDKPTHHVKQFRADPGDWRTWVYGGAQNPNT